MKKSNKVYCKLCDNELTIQYFKKHLQTKKHITNMKEKKAIVIQKFFRAFIKLRKELIKKEKINSIIGVECYYCKQPPFFSEGRALAECAYLKHSKCEYCAMENAIVFKWKYN
jgi:hypothetical protein